MTSLLRSQLRLALLGARRPRACWSPGCRCCSRWSPGLADVHVLGMPLPWVLLAFGVYPFLLLLGWLYVRAAERNERDFTEVVERP